MSRYSAIMPLLFCSLLLPSGCVKLPDDYGLYQEQPSDWAVEQNNVRLRSIESLIQAGKGNAAKQQADLVSQKELSSQQQAQFSLLSAQILLSFGEAEQAVGKLVSTDYGQLGTNDKIKFYQSEAFAYSLTGNLLESAKARIALDPLLTKPEERKKNQGVILENLGLLTQSATQNQTTDLLGWLSAAKILSTRNQDPTHFNTALAGWKATNPQHSANLYLATVANMPEDGSDLPKSIAILLPDSGPYLDPAKAIKAGFLAAHGRHNSSSSKPTLHFYDTEKGKVAEIYQLAVEEGAELVIGPLNKEKIQTLASTTLTIPVLALNQVPSLSKQNLYQFALSPLDDVAEITQKAAMDGHKKAVLLVPNNEQGKRVSSYFVEDWQALGGTILKKQTYDPAKTDFSTAIKSVVGIDESENRAKKVQEAFPAAQYTPHKREDVDVLFLSAYGKEGRIINPQVGGMPVYALPAIYSGLPDTANDTLLNGVTFCDTPWLFNGAYSGELSMMSLQDVLNQFPISYIRLVAMGIDAYHLAGKLGSLSAMPYSGATGKLSLAMGNRIKRSLVCAKFVMGQPELIGFTHSPNEGDYSGPGKPIAINPATAVH
jgi:uncharacterized protein